MIFALITWYFACLSLALNVPLHGQDLTARAADHSVHNHNHGYKSEGCYSGFFLSDIHFENASVTPQTCTKFCDEYRYFSLENGNECQCGSSISNLTASTSCNTACAGNSSEICGGFSRKSIYHHTKVLKVKPAPLPGNFKLKGCFNGGLLEVSHIQNSSVSVEFCADFCTGSKYMALENGNECSCGNETPDMTPQTRCDSGCVGNGNEFCGGFGQKNLYRS